MTRLSPLYLIGPRASDLPAGPAVGRPPLAYGTTPRQRCRLPHRPMLWRKEPTWPRRALVDATGVAPARGKPHRLLRTARLLVSPGTHGERSRTDTRGAYRRWGVRHTPRASGAYAGGFPGYRRSVPLPACPVALVVSPERQAGRKECAPPARAIYRPHPSFRTDPDAAQVTYRWWRWRDLHPRPAGYGPAELLLLYTASVVDRRGFAPLASCVQGRRSPD